MEFAAELPIYLQIEDYIKDKIFRKSWPPDSRIPAVRELAYQLQVNPNTIMKAYERLQNAAIIYSQRGMGFFVAATAWNQIQLEKKEVFFKSLPLLFDSMHLLQLPFETLQQAYADYLQSQSNISSK
jgi:GntR family transcriptional regulator